MKEPQPKKNQKRKRSKRWFRPRVRSIRRAVNEQSAGGVIFRRINGRTEILMIEDVKGRWSIPKGKIAEGERSQQAALREIKEETGLKNLRLLDWLGKVNFRYRHTDTLIMKSMQVYLIESLDLGEKLKPKRHSSGKDTEVIKSAKWFQPPEALDLVEYEDVNRMILLALKKIRNG